MIQYKLLQSSQSFQVRAKMVFEDKYIHHRKLTLTTGRKGIQKRLNRVIRQQVNALQKILIFAAKPEKAWEELSHGRGARFEELGHLGGFLVENWHVGIRRSSTSLRWGRRHGGGWSPLQCSWICRSWTISKDRL